MLCCGAQVSQQAAQRDFRAEIRVYDSVFKAVAEQVSVHCSERGNLLERIRAFYTKSVDVTARIAANAARTELAAQVKELQDQVAVIEKENMELKKNQVSNDPETDILRQFRRVSSQKKARIIGVLYAESGSLLMKTAEGEHLPLPDQASTLNHLLVHQSEGERAAVLTSLMNMAPIVEQFKLLRRILSAMPMAEQIKMSMEILVPEQHRRIMLGIFDSASGESEKAALLLDALYTMKARYAFVDAHSSACVLPCCHYDDCQITPYARSLTS